MLGYDVDCQYYVQNEVGSEEEKKKEERLVVGSSYAIVYPIAMMIEFVTTFIALSTMFGVVPHITFANRTS